MHTWHAWFLCSIFLYINQLCLGVVILCMRATTHGSHNIDWALCQFLCGKTGLTQLVGKDVHPGRLSLGMPKPLDRAIIRRGYRWLGEVMVIQLIEKLIMSNVISKKSTGSDATAFRSRVDAEVGKVDEKLTLLPPQQLHQPTSQFFWVIWNWLISSSS